MEWLRENFFWLVVGALFVWMHLKMHGGHGHGGHGGGRGGGHAGCGGAPDGPGGGSASESTSNEGGHHAEH
jgi:hypothetical protein